MVTLPMGRTLEISKSADPPSITVNFKKELKADEPQFFPITGILVRPWAVLAWGWNIELRIGKGNLSR
jgi:hypothetical protein